MSHKKSIGLPRMNALEGFRRDFSPDFVRNLSENCWSEILLEYGYGTDLNHPTSGYDGLPKVKFSDRKTIFDNSDVVMTLTCPDVSDYSTMSGGQALVSMLHYDTHPDRNEVFRNLGIHAVSLDDIRDTEGSRMVEDFRGCAYNAMTSGFKLLRASVKDDYWFNTGRGPITVYILGFGNIGKYTVEAAMRMGRTGFQEDLAGRKGNPMLEVMPTNSTHARNDHFSSYVNSRDLKEGGRPHILVDASKRKNPNEAILDEECLANLPQDSIIVDVTADRYACGVVKGIQGTPTGDEKKHIFRIGDPEWEDSAFVPQHLQLSKENRRTLASHYAWLSYGSVNDRVRNMERYGQQILPIMITLADMDFSNLGKYNINGSAIEKSIIGSVLSFYNLKNDSQYFISSFAEPS